MKKLAVVLFVLVYSTPLLAQRFPPPTLMVRMNDKSVPLKLAGVDVDVQIVGHLAQTRMTMTFYNPNSRRFAGDLYFPLPEGATVSGYALDIEGRMVDGVVVPKDKARQVFEAEVRKGIDPGLVEWVKGNNFKTRVFPIPPQGTRTVMVRYVSELVHDSKGPNFFLPLNFREAVDEFHLRVEVVKPEAPPQIKEGGLANFTFKTWRDSFLAETTLKGQKLTADLVVAIPDVRKQDVKLLEAGDGTVHFALSQVRPDMLGASARERPGRITLLWDASGSRGKTDHTREFQIVEDYFKGLAAGETMVDLVLFRNAPGKTTSFMVEGGNAGKLIEALKQVQYDGGTQMASITPAKGSVKPDFYLLFSDGISNFGKEEPQGLEAPVYAISGDASANHSFLRFVALKTGGAYYNLNRLENKDVVSAIGESPFSFLKATVVEGEVEGLYPSVPQPMGTRFMLAGRLKSKKAKVKLEFGSRGETQFSSEYVLEAGGAAKGDLLRIFWAQKKIDDLMIFPARNEDELVLTGQEFGLVTRGTSLMVLETLEQYVEHSIPPPESLPEMRKEYFEQVEEFHAQQKAEEEDKITRVLGMWKARIEWWETRFKYDPKLRIKSDEDGEDGAMMGMGGSGSGSGAGSVSGIGAAGPAPRESAPMMMRVMAGSSPDEQSVEEDERRLEREDRAPRKKMKSKNGEDHDEDVPPPPEPVITLKEWDPDTPYLKILKKASKKKYFKVYMGQRKEHGESPAFFLDCADFFFKKDQGALALQVLSNIAELELENAALLRVMAHKLAQQKFLDLSKQTFEAVLKLRPEEPQSFRDLALVLEQMKDFEKASELLYHVVLNEWDRFEEIEVIALMELNRMIVRANRAKKKIAERIDDRLVKLLDVDVRIILTWDSDLTDMDLWVTEPSGEKAFYSNNRTTIGGLVSRDFTQGYDPEEYCLRKRMPGVYKIEANYYGNSEPSVTGAVTLQVDIFTNFGRADEKRQSITIRLTTEKEVIKVGEVKF